MKSIWISLIFTGFLIAGNVSLCIGQAVEQLYQQGLMKEEGEGELQDAIALYNQVADNSGADISLRAKALLHIGMCYEKLGVQEAVEAYQRLVSSFPTATNEVAIAQERLDILMPVGEAENNSTETAKESEGIAIKQIWTGADIDLSGCVTLDGEYMSFVDWETGDLAIRNLKTGKNNRLTNDATWDMPMHFALNNVISPDGSQIAYSWYNNYGTFDLKLLKIDGQTAVTLFEAAEDEEIYPISWFSHENGIIVQKFKKMNDKYTWQLSSFDIDNREFRILKDFNTGFMTNLSLSRNEKFIAYDFPNEKDYGNFDINLMSIDGSEEINLVKHPANDRLLGWLPGRDELLFISNRSGIFDIWALQTAESGLSKEPKRILSNVGDISPQGFTQDGSLYCSVMYRKFDAFFVPHDPLTGKLSVDSSSFLLGSYGDIIWLPDGESIACIQYDQKPGNIQDYKLCVLNTGTHVQRDLASDIIVNGPPRLSPDNKSILMFGIDETRSKDENYKGGIYTVDILTGKVTEIKVKQDASNSYSVEWDKDGECIFYTSNNQLIKHNIITTEETLLYADEFMGITTLRRSHDGDHLLFDVQVSENEKHLKSIPIAGGNSRIISSFNSSYTPLLHKKIVLSPDGKYIYFSVDAAENGSILWRINADTGIQHKIWHSEKKITGINVHPDGNQMAVSVLDNVLEIRVIENLVSEIDKVFSEYE